MLKFYYYFLKYEYNSSGLPDSSKSKRIPFYTVKQFTIFLDFFFNKKKKLNNKLYNFLTDKEILGIFVWISMVLSCLNSKFLTTPIYSFASFDKVVMSQSNSE